MTQSERVLYTGKVRTIGGREGSSRSSDGRLDVQRPPPGSRGAGTDPEQLLAAGWSACFERAHGICPYSKATHGNIDVATRLV